MMMSPVPLACVTLFSFVFYVHYQHVSARLENNFLRYDDHLNFVEKGVDKWLYRNGNKSIARTLIEDVWTPVPDNCILKVWEPISSTLKMQKQDWGTFKYVSTDESGSDDDELRGYISTVDFISFELK